MKKILMACALTVATFAVSGSAMASAVPDLDAVSVVNSKTADVFQVAKKKTDKEEAYTSDPYKVRKHKRMKSKVEKATKPTPTYRTEEKGRTGGRVDWQDPTKSRKKPHYKRKSPRQCKRGQTAGCKNK